MSDTETPDEKVCFAIIPIGGAGTDVRKHSDLVLNEIISPVLSQAPFNYNVVRGDQEPDPGMVTDKIIDRVRNSQLCVVDLSFRNPNVFYELGMRHVAERPVILLAHADTDIPFDVAGNRVIFFDLMAYETKEVARKQLADQAEAVNGPGYKVSNPVTQANATIELANSKDTQDQMILGLRDEVVRLNRRFDELEHTLRGRSGAVNALARNIADTSLISSGRVLRPGDVTSIPSALTGRGAPPDKIE